MTHRFKAVMLATVLAGFSQAHATTYSVALTGDTANFNEQMFYFNGSHYDAFYLDLAGLDASNAITVSEGDTINSTVTLDSTYTIPASQKHTDFLQFFGGSNFPSENTGVTGTFTFFNGGVEVATYGYGSTTSNQLASYAALFPPNNGAITFDSFTNNVTITTLPVSATLDSSSIEYALVSPAPEPASWALMLVGFGLLGGVARRRVARLAA